MPDPTPPTPSTPVSPKVVAGGLAGASTIILVWGLRQFVGVELPGEVASAVTTLLSGVAAFFKKD